MAKLTKPQQNELDTACDQRDMARALSWPNMARPMPLKKPEYGDGGERLIHGWAFNAYIERVYEEWQDTSCSYSTKPPKDSYITGSRGRGELYATQQEAYLAMYIQMCHEFAAKLARVLKKAKQ